MLQVDFAKAFDSLEWDAVDQALEYFGSPQYIIEVCDLLHCDFSTGIIGKTAWSQSISVQRGVLQGAPASPTLFVLAAELMARVLRRDPEIMGIIMDGCEKLLS